MCHPVNASSNRKKKKTVRFQVKLKLDFLEYSLRLLCQVQAITSSVLLWLVKYMQPGARIKSKLCFLSRVSVLLQAPKPEWFPSDAYWQRRGRTNHMWGWLLSVFAAQTPTKLLEVWHMSVLTYFTSHQYRCVCVCVCHTPKWHFIRLWSVMLSSCQSPRHSSQTEPVSVCVCAGMCECVCVCKRCESAAPQIMPGVCHRVTASCCLGNTHTHTHMHALPSSPQPFLPRAFISNSFPSISAINHPGLSSNAAVAPKDEEREQCIHKETRAETG